MTSTLQHLTIKKIINNKLVQVISDLVQVINDLNTLNKFRDLISNWRGDDIYSCFGLILLLPLFQIMSNLDNFTQCS